MIDFTNELYEKMQNQTANIRLAESDPLQAAERSFHIVETTIMKLKKFILAYEFKNKGEEILFFKKIKPKFHRELIYLIEIIHIETNLPLGYSNASIISYFQQIAERIRLHFVTQNVLYIYYRTNRTSEDELLFTRDNDCIPMIREDNVDQDNQFSTIASGNFARIMGFEMVLEYVELKIHQLERPQLVDASQKNECMWTDSIAALTELAYAIHAAGSVNRGKADIKDIIMALSTAFHAVPGNYYRTFQSIRIRKKNRTAYLENLKENLEKRMDETDMNY